MPGRIESYVGALEDDLVAEKGDVGPDDLRQRIDEANVVGELRKQGTACGETHVNAAAQRLFGIPSGFGGLSAEALKTRLEDLEAAVVELLVELEI